MDTQPPAGDPVDPLVLLELRVARRADEIASQLEGGPLSLNLPCWLKAEEEVFAFSMALRSSPDQSDDPARPPGL